MSVIRWIIAATIFLALLFVSLDNAQTVTLKLFRLTTYEAPLIFVVFLAFAVGVAAGLSAGVLRNARLKRQVSKLRREQQQKAVSEPAPHGAAPTQARNVPPEPPGRDPWNAG